MNCYLSFVIFKYQFHTSRLGFMLFRSGTTSLIGSKIILLSHIFLFSSDEHNLPINLIQPPIWAAPFGHCLLIWWPQARFLRYVPIPSMLLFNFCSLSGYNTMKSGFMTMYIHEYFLYLSPLPLLHASLKFFCAKKLVSFCACILYSFGFYILQITGETVGEVKPVADMHQRKAEMAKHSDAFIALPGWYLYAIMPFPFSRSTSQTSWHE